MDPISPNLIAGLAVEAVKGFVQRRETPARTSIRGRRLTDRAFAGKKTLLPILAKLTELVSPAEEILLGKFLHSSEFRSIARTTAVACIMGNINDLRPALDSQLSATLTLLLNIPASKSTAVSGTIIRALAEQSTAAVDELRRFEPEEYTNVRGRAAIEVAGGRLRSVSEHAESLTGIEPAQMPAILKFIEDYRRVARAANSELVPAYFETQKRVPINAIHIAPRLSPDRPEDFGIIPEEDAETHTEYEIGLSVLLGRGYRVVVLGDPGAGKSTLSQRIVYDLSGPPAAGFEGDKVPFVVTLRRYEEHKRARSSSLVEYLEDSLNEDLHIEPPPGAVKFLLATGKAVVIFDGLDELLETHRRREITKSIEAFGSTYATTHLIATSRVVGYREAALDPSIFQVATLRSFNDDDVEAYASKWFKLDDRLTAAEKVAVSAAFLRESSSVADLRSNPLMLGLLCNVYRGERSIPQDRAELYDQCARMLFEKWDASRGIRTTSILKKDARKALQSIALWIFADYNPVDGVPEGLLKRRIAKQWLGGRHESIDDAVDEASSLLESWRGRAWVLTDVGVNSRNERLYKFTHQTFLEYFAARELVVRNSSPRRLWKVLGAKISQGEWDIVAQISMQILDQYYGDAIDKMYEYLLQDAGEAHGHEAWNLLSFASRYLDVLLPSTSICRKVTDVAIEMALRGQVENYLEFASDDVSRLAAAGADADTDYAIDLEVEDLLTPLVTLLVAHGQVSTITQDEFILHLERLLESSDRGISAAAFTMLGSFSEVAEIVDIVEGEDLRLGTPDWDLYRPVLDRRLGEWSAVSFRPALVAFKHRLIDPEQLVSLVPSTSLFSPDPAILHGVLASRGKRAAGLHILHAYLGDPRSDFTEEQAASALAILGKELMKKKPPYTTQPLWDALGLRELVVKPYFRTDQSAADIPMLEEELRERAAAPDLAVAFAASVLLGAVVESEGWELLDESDDQIAFLNLGPLQALEMLFVCRLESGMYFDMRRAIDGAGFDDKSRSALIDWAERKVGFTASRLAESLSYR
ncbi:NACHT domain-containing protein [Micromonospora sp. URMC 105]|uniref:NACHT domain-containing protein n=1 Tax=Micromonospora sp. URMC 105 TaxID=3423413 RepID=UPI003F1D242D